MNILLQDVGVQTYLFDFRLPYSLLSVTSAQQLLGYTNIPTNLDLVVTVCVDSQHSFSTKLPFRATSHISDPMLVILGSEFQNTCERMGLTSFAGFFSPVSSTPSANIPGGVNRLFTHPQRGAEDILESLPGRFALPPGSFTLQVVFLSLWFLLRVLNPHWFWPSSELIIRRCVRRPISLHSYASLHPRTHRL
ncbi:hypothetical protein FB446DRAFT_104832 [Lentinula raphanica]|nr:hypothetical protein FB446DRAFT_104832 [Lentinula raphanica]